MTKKMDAEWKSQNSLQFDNNTHTPFVCKLLMAKQLIFQLKMTFAIKIRICSHDFVIVKIWPDLLTFFTQYVGNFSFVGTLVVLVGTNDEKRNAIALCIIPMQASCGEDLYWVSKVLPVLYDEKYFNLNERRPQHSVFLS